MNDRSADSPAAYLGLVALAAYLVVLLGLTLQPSTFDADSALRFNFRPFASIGPALRLGPESFAFRQVVGNIVAFIPLGLLLPLASSRLAWAWVPLAGLALSVTIEACQLAISLAVGYGYRAADVDDVILNATGVLIGYSAFVAGRTAFRFLRVRRSRA